MADASRAGSVSIGAVGGTIVNRKDPASATALTAAALERMDFSFCHLDTVFSTHGAPQLQALSAQRADPANAEALRMFSVASLASNHCMDWGPEAFEDTLEVLGRVGVAVVGAGRDLEEARRPVILQANGVRVAFLARNSILLTGYEAGARTPGCAPMRAHTAYIPIEPDQPGTPCRIHTFVDPADLGALKEDVAAARAQADILFVSLHAGIHIEPVVLADYQREAAYAAIDAGADIVFQHHGHILKGIEMYRGKPIFYSMSNYLMDIHIPAEHWRSSPALSKLVEAYGILIDEFGRGDYATYPFAPDARKTGIARFEVTNRRLSGTFLIPAYIRPDGTPEVLTRKQPRAQEVFEYAVSVTGQAALNARFEWDGDEIRVAEA